MTVEATQPAAGQLLDYEQLRARLEALRKSPRVSVVSIGTTTEGRPIPMAIITAPGVPVDDLARRTREALSPAPSGTRLDRWILPAANPSGPGLRLPVLFAGASWGHEAAHVEGLVAAAEHLAFDESPETKAALSATVALVVPSMNPDGRERAIAEWREAPLAVGERGVGNAAEFMINRDFVHQTQPEARAILGVLRAWRPVAGIDMHEDMFTLGVAIDAVAFVPPFMPGLDVEEHPLTRGAIRRLGGAIAARWRAAGFHVAHEPDGTPLFAPMPARGSGQLNPVAGSSGRLELLFGIHGAAGYITESARTPGSQTWEARVEQKTLAALTTLAEVARDTAFFARAMTDRQQSEAEAGRGDFVAVSWDQPAGVAIDELRRLLVAHGVRIYAALGQRSDVIPLEQRAAAFIRHAVLGERSKLNDLPAALGVTVQRAGDLPEATRAALMAAELVPVVPPTEAWPSRPADPRLAKVRVGIYAGQGADRPGWGELRFVLGWHGLNPVILEAADVTDGRLRDIDVLIVPDADPVHLVEGSPDPPNTWQRSSPRAGLGPNGLAAVAAFVRNGGRLVLVGRSAAVASKEAADLLPITMVEGPAARPGIGQVLLRDTPHGAVLFDGVPRAAGAPVRAFLSAPPGPRGGYLMEVADDASVAARFAGVNEAPAELSFADTSRLQPAARQPAVIDAAVGKGRVVIFTIAPAFRAQWRSTFPMVLNALRP